MLELVLPIPTLETERLRLRSLRTSDFDDYAAMYADREVLRLSTITQFSPLSIT
jgi:RimJ/RimL family protein N-acetyltransferase